MLTFINWEKVGELSDKLQAQQEIIAKLRAQNERSEKRLRKSY